VDYKSRSDERGKTFEDLRDVVSMRIVAEDEDDDGGEQEDEDEGRIEASRGRTLAVAANAGDETARKASRVFTTVEAAPTLRIELQTTRHALSRILEAVTFAVG
jgi:hypothetical protein